MTWVKVRFYFSIVPCQLAIVKFLVTQLSVVFHAAPFIGIEPNKSQQLRLRIMLENTNENNKNKDQWQCHCLYFPIQFSNHSFETADNRKMAICTSHVYKI